MRGNGESKLEARGPKTPFLRSSDHQFVRGAFYCSSVNDMLDIESGEDIESAAAPCC